MHFHQAVADCVVALLAKRRKEQPMQKLVVLATLVFALGTAHQAAACDMGAIAAYVAGSTDEQTTQQAADCTGQNCSKPESAAPTVATDRPLAAPVNVAADGSCTGSNC